MRRCERCLAPVNAPVMSREVDGGRQGWFSSCLNGHTVEIAATKPFSSSAVLDDRNGEGTEWTCKVKGCHGRESDEKGYCFYHRNLLWRDGRFDRRMLYRETARYRLTKNGGENGGPKMGVDSIRLLLMKAEKPMRYSEIRIGLCRNGMEKRDCSVSAILLRLMAQGEVERVERGVYRSLMETPS